MRIVFAHEHPKVKRPDSIFLAGPSPRGKEDYNWRPEALDLLTELGFSGTVYVPLPRDGEWTDNYDGQIDWELEYLDAAGARVFWIPRSAELPGFTTNVEYGLYLKQPNMVCHTASRLMTKRAGLRPCSIFIYKTQKPLSGLCAKE